MEIGFFSKCVKDLIVDLDRVDIPGLGVFFTEDVPSTISDKGNTINPPQRKLFFKRQDIASEPDNDFIKALVNSLNLDYDQANTELQWCLSRIHSELTGNRICALPGLGEMKSTNTGEYFFVPDEDLDICPDSFGLEPVCVKMPKVSDSPSAEPVKPTKSDERRERHVGHTVFIVLLVLLAVIVISGVIFYFLFPEQADILLDSLLYTPEELELLGR